MKIKLNDTVLVITGKDKGKTGTVIKTLKDKDQVVIEAVNIKTKHVKKSKGKKGEIIKFESPVHVSNVKLICPETKKATRVGYLIKGDKKIRIAKKSNVELDKKASKS